jgi:hypothetical protein
MIKTGTLVNRITGVFLILILLPHLILLMQTQVLVL